MLDTRQSEALAEVRQSLSDAMEQFDDQRFYGLLILSTFSSDETKGMGLPIQDLDKLISNEPETLAVLRSLAFCSRELIGVADGLSGAETLARESLASAPLIESNSNEDSVPKATKLLMGWPEILDAIGQPDSKRNSIRGLNKKADGPIKIGKQGAKPMADRSKLILWWNSLLERQEEAAEAGKRQAATIDAHFGDSATYLHGRESATVAPEIQGTVRSRRNPKPNT